MEYQTMMGLLVMQNQGVAGFSVLAMVFVCLLLVVGLLVLFFLVLLFMGKRAGDNSREKNGDKKTVNSKNKTEIRAKTANISTLAQNPAGAGALCPVKKESTRRGQWGLASVMADTEPF